MTRDEAQELAFSAYIRADRDIGRAMGLVAEEWPDSETEGPPSRATLYRWAKEGNWAAKADMAIAESFPHITFRNTARLVALQGEALATYAAAMAGELDHLKQGAIMARMKAAESSLLLSGIGTAGAKAEGATLSPNSPVSMLAEGVVEALPAIERARRQRERLDQERGRA